MRTPWDLEPHGCLRREQFADRGLTFIDGVRGSSSTILKATGTQ